MLRLALLLATVVYGDVYCPTGATVNRIQLNVNNALGSTTFGESGARFAAAALLLTRMPQSPTCSASRTGPRLWRARGRRQRHMLACR